jgi:hypothetical protein
VKSYKSQRYQRKKKPDTTLLTALLIRDVSRAVKDQFKALCAKKGVSMSKEIENYMRDRVRAHNEEDVL